MIITFDYLFYTFIYSDVNKNFYLAKKHFLTLGIKQNRYGSILHFYSINNSFKWQEYTNHEPPYTELNAIKHYILFSPPILNDNFVGVPEFQTRIMNQIDNVSNENKQNIINLNQRIDCIENKLQIETVDTEHSVIIDTTGKLTKLPTNDSLKININPLKGILNKISKFNPISFNWKNNSTKEYGFISSEINTLLDINTSNSNEFDYVKLIPLLVQGIKELNEKNQELDNEIKRLNYIINNGYY